MSLAIQVPNVETSAEILRQAVPQMSALDIPVTPENYTVWYEYFLGINLDLKRAIDGLLANKVVFTFEVNQGLYSNFIQEHSPEIIENVQVETQIIIGSLLNKISLLSSGTEQFSQVLEKLGNELNDADDVASIQAMLDGFAQEVDSVLKNNLEMKQNLASMSEELSALKVEMQNLSMSAMTDQLTSLHNRRAFELEAQKLMHEFKDQHVKSSLLIIDIDHFKQFNDKYGHIVGDKVLAYVALALKQGVRGDDFVARYGGEEFIVLLPNTRFHDALQVAENLRERVAAKKLSIGKDKKLSLGAITVSVGLTSLQDGDDLEAFLSRADRALYRAKSDGRNCVRGD